jgi:toxin HigB-1
MIRSFRDQKTEEVFNGRCPKGFPPDLLKTARRKLRMLDAAHDLKDLKSPPENRLHPLLKDRAGQHAISINDQFRLCFIWRDGEAHEVEITDYH